MSERVTRRMECYFGLYGSIFAGTFLFLAAIFTPGYDPRTMTISSLGFGVAKSLFSIAFVSFGLFLIPFFVYLQRELVNINEKLRKFTGGAAIFTSICIAMVGIIPDETYFDIFILFHGFVAVVAFLGSDIFIGLYSILMYIGPKSKLYTGHKFKRRLAYFGFSVNIPLILLIITRSPMMEWILFIFTIAWFFLTALSLMKYRFFNIEGIYYKKSQYLEALKRFQESLDLLEKLDLKDHTIKEKIKENIEFLKLEKEKREKLEEYIDFWRQ